MLSSRMGSYCLCRSEQGGMTSRGGRCRDGTEAARSRNNAWKRQQRNAAVGSRAALLQYHTSGEDGVSLAWSPADEDEEEQTTHYLPARRTAGSSPKLGCGAVPCATFRATTSTASCTQVSTYQCGSLGRASVSVDWLILGIVGCPSFRDHTPCPMGKQHTSDPVVLAVWPVWPVCLSGCFLDNCWPYAQIVYAKMGAAPLPLVRCPWYLDTSWKGPSRTQWWAHAWQPYQLPAASRMIEAQVESAYIVLHRHLIFRSCDYSTFGLFFYPSPQRTSARALSRPPCLGTASCRPRSESKTRSHVSHCVGSCTSVRRTGAFHEQPCTILLPGPHGRAGQREGDGGQRHRVRVPEAGWTKGLLVEAGTGGLSLTEDLCTQDTQCPSSDAN